MSDETNQPFVTLQARSADCDPEHASRCDHWIPAKGWFSSPIPDNRGTKRTMARSGASLVMWSLACLRITCMEPPNEPVKKSRFWLFSESWVFDFIDSKFSKNDFFCRLNARLNRLPTECSGISSPGWSRVNLWSYHLKKAWKLLFYNKKHLKYWVFWISIDQ